MSLVSSSKYKSFDVSQNGIRLCSFARIMDLKKARARAMQCEDYSGDYLALQVIIFDLCDEINELRKHEKSPRTHSEE